MANLFGEAIGTFIFLLAILCVLFRRTDPTPAHVAPIVIALALLVAIVVASGLEGSAHLNPVVSMVMGMNGQISGEEVFQHVVAQVIGATGALLVFQVVHSSLLQKK